MVLHTAYVQDELTATLGTHLSPDVIKATQVHVVRS